jgi:hypothetical protein
LVFSITLLNAYGFLTLPDTPLLFFTAFFLWVYKIFINKPSIPIAIGLGILMALMMYSKYHAALVILFVLISNIKLIRNPYAWLALMVSLFCYLPHLLWLRENDYVSILYHLFERPNQAYEFGDFTLVYFVNLIALFGLTFPWVYYILIKTRSKDQFTRTLLFLIYGLIIFFFISSFNRRVQTQWLIVICLPLFILTYNYILSNEKIRKWIFRAALVNCILILYLRLGLVHQELSPIVYETHGNKAWVNTLDEEAGETTVVFENSYRRAPMYSFYSGKDSYSVNNIMYRQNQYSIDNSEARVQHKDVIYVSPYDKSETIHLKLEDGDELYGRPIQNFESFRKLKCTVNQNKAFDVSAIEFEVYNPYQEQIALNKINFGMAFLNKYKQVLEVIPIEVNLIDAKHTSLAPKESTRFSVSSTISFKKEFHYIRICISENNLYYGLNSTPLKIQ